MAECSERKHCTYYIQRKDRYCRLEAVKGSNYCGEHMVNEDAQVIIVIRRVSLFIALVFLG